MTTNDLANRRLIAAAMVGGFGMFLGVFGDYFTLYDATAAGRFSGALVTRPEELLLILAAKPPAHFVIGQFFALIGLPLGLFGVFAFVRVLRRRFPRGAGVTAVVAAFAYILGVAWHTTLGAAGATVSGVSDPAALSEAATRLEPLAGATTVSFYLAGFAAFLLILMQIVKDPEMPNWLAWVSPLPVHIVGFFVATVIPPAVGVFLQFSLSNLSGMLFYFLFALHLWKSEL